MSGWTATAEQLARMPITYNRLLMTHVATAAGKCRACTQPGTGLPCTPWPCPTHRLATLAQELHRKRVGGQHLRGRPG